jgi:hypothetical protein
MWRYRVPLEQLLADLQRYHSYLLQDPCANPHALAYVEARISLCQAMSSPRSGSTDSGELAGLPRAMYSSGRSRSSDSREKVNVTT